MLRTKQLPFKIAVCTLFLLIHITGTSFAQNLNERDSIIRSYRNTQKPVETLSLPEIIEFAPSISADGKTIIFETNRSGGFFQLFETQKDESGNWGTPEPLDNINKEVDSTDLIAGPSISFDGNLLYFSSTHAPGRTMDIYVSRRTTDGWGSPERLSEVINTPTGYEGFPSISADGKTLYFVQVNNEGPQDKDLQKEMGFCLSIFKSEMQPDGEWGKPVKLPAPINQDCEKAPRIMADGRTLIFSSNRPGGMGDYDMYQSTLNELDEWSFPQPLNYVNTTESDQLPCISAQGDLMYYVYDNKDIYSVVIPPELRQFKNAVIQGTIVDQDTEKGIDAKIFIRDAFTSEIVMELENNPEDGKYSVVLPLGNSYNLDIKKPGYSGFFSSIDLRDVQEYEERELNIELFKTVRMTISINDKELFVPVPARVQVRRKSESSFFKEVNVNDGRISVDVPIGSEYEFIVSSDNFKSEIFSFDITKLVMYRDFEKEIELEPEKVEVMINVADLMNNSRVKSKIVLKNKNRDEYIEVTGNEMVKLRAGDRYELEATSDQGYAFNSTVIDVTKTGNIDVELKLQKLEENARLTLKDILFESNSAALNSISYTELNRVIQMMKENPGLQIEIAAHTDDIGHEKYNQLLSQRRATSVLDYFLENNIEGERFTAVGYGESQPKLPNDSEENRSVNRRVEIIIKEI